MNISFSSFFTYMILFANSVEVLTENNGGKLSEILLPKEELQSHFQIKRDTSDVDRSEVVNHEFKKIIEFVNVLDELDNFIYDSTRSIIRKLNAVYDVDEDERYRKSRSLDERVECRKESDSTSNII